MENQQKLHNDNLYPQYVILLSLANSEYTAYMSCTFFVHLVVHHLSGESPCFGGRGKLRQGAKQGLRASGSQALTTR